MPMAQVPDWLRLHTVRVRHVAVIVWLVSTAIAATVLAAAPALAVTGFELDLTISPASGPVSSVPTWSTSTACLSGYQGSAVLYELNTDGSVALAISPVVADVTSPFTGMLLAGDTVGSVLAASNVTPGGTVQWVVECSSGPGGTGSSVYVQSVDVTLSPDGSSYTTACTGVNACLIPPSGATSLTPGWATTTYCPAAYLFSAALYTLNSDGSLGTRISPVVTTNVGAPFSGTLLGDVAQDISGTGVTDGETDVFEVVCFGPLGAAGEGDDIGSIYVTLSADGSSYTSSGTPPPLTATTTTMTASPQPAVPDTQLTMTATVTAADGTYPAGSVLFELGGPGSPVFIGGPVAVNADGVATTTSTYFSYVAGSYLLEAVFTPANIFSYASSTGTFTETVNGGTVPVTVTIPPSGAFTVTVTPGTVTLAEQGTSYPLVAAGMLQPVTVADTRNTYPGWSASGQASVFTGGGTAAGSTIPGDQLGWVPTGILAGGAALGPTVAPGTSPGLGDTAQVLAAATPGNGTGTSTLGANLTLDLPSTALAGPYTATLTLTFAESGP
jgi:hypothetical protein